MGFMKEAEMEAKRALLEVGDLPKKEIRLKLTRRIRRLRLAAGSYGLSPGMAAPQDRRRARDREAGRKAAQALRELEVRRRIELGGRDVAIPKNLQPSTSTLMGILGGTPLPVVRLKTRAVAHKPGPGGKKRRRK